jgi:DNA-directed RNA polymerase sigma subunit (sigma70/sigma32)
MKDFHTSDYIDLGLAIAQAANPGKQLSLREIAAYCECSPETIARIERKALAKLRKALGISRKSYLFL